MSVHHQLERGPVAASMTRWSARTARVGVVVALVLLALVLLTPTALGGATSYVVTSGTSMLPTYRAEGVVLTRTAADYRVGDVVAYRSGDLGAVVMHRIVARQGDGYVFQGDNNDYLDRYVASEADLIGREWVYLPGAGPAVSRLRNPAVFGGLVALVAFVSLLLPAPSRHRRRSRAA